MISNLVPFKNGVEKIHELSAPYPNYSHEETEAKITHAIKDAPKPHTCEFIHSSGFEDCEQCPFWQKVKAPAAIPHYASGDTDNWEMYTF